MGPSRVRVTEPRVPTVNMGAVSFWDKRRAFARHTDPRSGKGLGLRPCATGQPPTPPSFYLAEGGPCLPPPPLLQTLSK